jgi:hypothetical protein
LFLTLTSRRYERAWQELFVKERSYRRACKEILKKTLTPALQASLITVNTRSSDVLVERTIDSSNPLAMIDTSHWCSSDAYFKQRIKTVGGVSSLDGNILKMPKSDATFKDYWAWTTSNPSLSFRLAYRISTQQIPSSLQQPLGLLETSFFPFQRGFYTRLEADLDQAMLDDWSQKAKAKILPPRALNQPFNLLVASDVNVRLATHIEEGQGNRVSAGLLPQTVLVDPHPRTIAVWNDLANSKPIHTGGIQLVEPQIVMPDSIPEKFASVLDVALPSRVLAITNAALALPNPTDAWSGNEIMHTTSSFDVRASDTLAPTPASVVPPGFTLKSKVKVFGMLDVELWSIHGDTSVGHREILIPVDQQSLRISSFVPEAAGTALDDIELQGLRLVYNEYTTATDTVGTWLETQIVLAGGMKHIGTVVANVFGLSSPAIKEQTLLSSSHDWKRLPQPSGFCLQGSLPVPMKATGSPGTIRLGDLEFLNVLLCVSAGYTKNVDPSSNRTIETLKWGFGFSGSVWLHLPRLGAPLSLDYSLVESDGILHLQLTSTRSTVLTNFAGVDGFSLTYLTLATTFDIASKPTLRRATASAGSRH